jgi:hypothetical protein
MATNHGRKHLDLVNLLKTAHGTGHGHANALVAHTLADTAKGLTNRADQRGGSALGTSGR